MSNDDKREQQPSWVEPTRLIWGVGNRLMTRAGEYRAAGSHLQIGTADPVRRVRQWLDGLRDGS